MFCTDHAVYQIFNYINFSLSQPLVFPPHSSFQTDSNISSNHHQSTNHNITNSSHQSTQIHEPGKASEEHHRRREEGRGAKSGVQEDRGPSVEEEEEHETIHNWLRNSQDSFRTGASFIATEDIKSSNLSVSELVNKFQGPSGLQGSEGFLPQGQHLEYVSVSNSVPAAYPSAAVAIRPPQHGNSQGSNQNPPRVISSNRVHDRSFDSARSANQREEQSFPERFAQSLPVKGRSASPTHSHQSKG